ncbi:hypothetical protein L7F22_041369 [Adiantum nelumboides]|nr:hypothetical protein [Adiantum nelumboides]
MQLAMVGSAVKTVQVSYRFKDVSVRPLERESNIWSHLLRPMIIKGLMEPNSRTNVNFVNADYVAKQQGLVITEECNSDKEEGSSEGTLESMQVRIAQVESKFARALLSNSDEIAFEGELKHGCTPFLSKVGSFEVDISLDGRLILMGHPNQPIFDEGHQPL